MDIKDYIDLNAEADKIYRETLEKVGKSEGFANLSKMIENGKPFYEIAKECELCAENLGVNKYSFQMTLLFANIGVAASRWENNGFSEKIFKDTAEDFLYKINECKEVYGVWGIAPFDWYEHLFNARLFKLGRLQFQPQGDDIYVHIPSCGPLEHTEVINSYKKAFEFFKKSEDVAFKCGSYLLFPPYLGTVFAEGTNIYRFASDFEILSVNYTENFGDAWRIFGCDFCGDTSKLPCKTSMQKSFITYINSGGKFGTATGKLKFDKKAMTI